MSFAVRRGAVARATPSAASRPIRSYAPTSRWRGLARPSSSVGGSNSASQASCIVRAAASAPRSAARCSRHPDQTPDRPGSHTGHVRQTALACVHRRLNGVTTPRPSVTGRWTRCFATDRRRPPLRGDRSVADPAGLASPSRLGEPVHRTVRPTGDEERRSVSNAPSGGRASGSVRTGHRRTCKLAAGPGHHVPRLAVAAHPDLPPALPLSYPPCPRLRDRAFLRKLANRSAIQG